MDLPVVEISDGKVRGCTRINLNGKEFFSFLGIPYGKPPIGKLRFKAPQPAEPWKDVFDATKEGDACYQLNFLGPTCSEDCLNLNVFTRELPRQNAQLKPVMVWIHGGAFIMGSSNLITTDPKFLMTEDIVLVTVHYRVGFLGFLSLEDTSLEVPGNAGLKDQLLALKWVQKNIKHFGGDKDNVTIFGVSAGGVMVHQHVLSQQSKGLFHKAIIQGGAALNPWAYGGHHDDFIKSLKEGVKSKKEALEFLRSLSPQELCLRQEEYFNEDFGKIAAVIEKPNETAFLTENAADTISSGKYNKVPIMIGYCSNEGLLFEGYPTLARTTTNLIFNESPSWESLEGFIAGYLKLEKGSETCSTISKKLADFYFQGRNAEDKHLFPTDYHFAAGIIGSAKMHSRTSKDSIYLYRMSLVTGLNPIKKLLNVEKHPGACHGDDLGYLFSFYISADSPLAEKEKIGVERFVKLWTNFAKYGNPTPKGTDLEIQWKPVEDDGVYFLDIGDELKLHIDPESERMKVWKEVFHLSPHTSRYM